MTRLTGLTIATALALLPVFPAGSATPAEIRYKGKCVSNPPVESMTKGRLPVADVVIPKCDTLVMVANPTRLTFHKGGKPAYSFAGHFEEPSTMTVDEITNGDAAPIRVESGSCAAYGKLPGPMLTTCVADWQSDGRRVGVVILFDVKKRLP